MNLYQISNHPQDSSVIRKAGRAGIESQELQSPDQLYVILRIVVKHYKNIEGELEHYTLIPDYIFELKASNSTFVNYNTGEYVTSDDQYAMGEADFFINVVSGLNSSINGLTEIKIARADSLQRFDNYSAARIVNWM